MHRSFGAGWWSWFGPGGIRRSWGGSSKSGQAIRNWVKQADLDGGQRSDGLTSQEQDELRRLRRENKQLRVEREILAKATAWFARETDAVPRTSTDS